MSLVLIATVALAAVCGVAAAANAGATAAVNASVAGVVREEYVSVTFDFWLHNDTTYGHKWDNASALTIDLEDPRLVALASGLAPGVLRVGGSPEDWVVYDTGGCKPGTPVKNVCTDSIYGCLTPQRWHDLRAFAKKTGLRLVYGLNACYNRPNAWSAMDMSNIQAMLEAVATSSADTDGALWGLELGNELHGIVDGAAIGLDVARLSALVDTVWASAQSTQPKPVLIAPDDYIIDTQYYADLIDAANSQRPNAILAVTYHQYPNCEPADGVVLPMSCLAALHQPPNALYPVALERNVELWSGEGAEHSTGGIPGLTDVFTSSFYMAYKLGILSLSNVTLSARQCLVGGDYTLLDRTTFAPNPDYWLAWLWSKLVPRAAHPVNQDAVSQAAGLRVFGHTGVDGVSGAVAVFTNVNTTSGFNVTLTWADSITVGATRKEFHLTGDPKGKVVSVNGTPLTFNGTLPQLYPVTAPADTPVVVAAASIVFVMA